MTKIEIIEALAEIEMTPGRHVVIQEVDLMVQRGDIDQLPLDHSSSHFEHRYALPNS